MVKLSFSRFNLQDSVSMYLSRHKNCFLSTSICEISVWLNQVSVGLVYKTVFQCTCQGIRTVFYLPYL